jgi:hypothetical protein
MSNLTPKDLLIARLKMKLIAATLSRRDYLTCRNTVRILRSSGAPLNPEMEEKVKKIEALVAAYEEANA